MKRTLLEIVVATTVLVLLTSFHHQISRIKENDADVASLRRMVSVAVDQAGGAAQSGKAEKELMAQLYSRLESLEGRLAQTAVADEEARKLRADIESTRLEADRFRAEIASDVNRTKELVDAYHKEFRALDRRANDEIAEAQSFLQDLTQRFFPDHTSLTQKMLAPTVQLNGEDTVGSGTLIFSDVNPATQRVETYVLTSNHVVRNILADAGAAKRNGIAVTIYSANGNVEEVADVVSNDADIDAALLKLRSETRYDNVAHVVPRDRTHGIRVWDPVYAVGCPLGNDPIPTRGEISSTKNDLKGSNYWMINAPTYFGNSGGGVYLAETRELVGVFSKIYTHGRGNPVVVPHMGLCTPIDSIYAWLDHENMSFVLGEPMPIDLSAQAAPPK